MNIKFASQDKIDDVEDQAHAFIKAIFGINDCFLTDESTLSDFALSLTPDNALGLPYDDIVEFAEIEMVSRIYTMYNIAVTPAERIVDVIDKINSPKPTLH